MRPVRAIGPAHTGVNGGAGLNSGGVARISPGTSVASEREFMATTNPFQFIQQVRTEVSKIVWPTRREVVLTTIMVFIMATLTAIFFALVDLGIRSGLQGILSMIGTG